MWKSYESACTLSPCRAGRRDATRPFVLGHAPSSRLAFRAIFLTFLPCRLRRENIRRAFSGCSASRYRDWHRPRRRLSAPRRLASPRFARFPRLPARKVRADARCSVGGIIGRADCAHWRPGMERNIFSRPLPLERYDCCSKDVYHRAEDI